MIEWLQHTWASILELGERHNVNPILFAVLYVGSIPPYLASLGWLARNARLKKQVQLPILSTLFFFIVPSLYIAIWGRDVAWWVYAVIAGFIIYGGYSTVTKIRSRMHTPSS
ncbi:MAG: hypothetical protein AAFW89_12430 [Bacteroidota bacterium]